MLSSERGVVEIHSGAQLMVSMMLDRYGFLCQREGGSSRERRAAGLRVKCEMTF